MTILFNVKDIQQLKKGFPDWVIVAGDRDKNPESLGKGWKKQTQTMEEFENLIHCCQASKTEFWNYGIITGLHNVCSVDFDWEFIYGLWVQKFGDRANTLTYRTPNLGYRVLFYSTEKDNSNPYKVPLHTEFLNNQYAAIGGYAVTAEGNKGEYTLVKQTPLLTDNILGLDTRRFLAEILERYDFLQFQCVNQTVNMKHIRLEHNQRLALLAFMLSKNFDDAEIHNFFKSVYDAKGRDYNCTKTQEQIEAGKVYKEKGRKPHPCTPKEYEDGKQSTALYDVFVSDPKTVCSRCKRRRKPEKTTELPESGTLEAAGYAIRPALRGSGFILYKLGEKEEAVDIVRETQKWIDETVKTLNIQPSSALKLALVKAKSTPKKPVGEQKNIKMLDIVTSDIHQSAPDSGTIDGRAYLGLWLPTRVTDENGRTLTHKFYLLFSDGELILGDTETLGEHSIYLTTTPIYTPLKISVETVLNLAELPRINPIDVVNKLIDILKKYIEFDDSRYYIFTAIWIIGTYFHKKFSSYPYYYLNAVKRSGKTKLLTVISLTAYNAVFSPNMSTSSLFRLTQSAGATTLIDETEDLNDPEKKADFRQLFNSGYKHGAIVYRTEKVNDLFIPTPYDPYSPKGLASISGLEDVLEDRCITLTMKRGRNPTITNCNIPFDDPIWIEMRDLLSRLYFQEWAAVENEYNQTQDIFSVVSEVSEVSVVIRRVKEKNNIYVSRNWELWQPLLSLGKHILFYFPTSQETTLTTLTAQTTLNKDELTLFEQLLDLSVDLILEKENENTLDIGEPLLLMGMLQCVTANNYYKISSLKEAASQFTDELPEWFNPKWIGRALKRLGFKEKRRVTKGMEYKLTPEKVADMAERLGVTLPPEVASEDSSTFSNCYFCKKPVNPIGAVYSPKLTENKPAHEECLEKYKAAQIAQTQEVEVKPETTEIGESDVNQYTQLCCYFCQKAITDDKWTSNDFTENKPSHKKCFDDAKAQLKGAS